MKLIVINAKKIIGYTMVFAGFMLLLSCFGKYYKEVWLAANPMHNIAVVIDAGHGGRDPGAIGKTGTSEDKINLAIALKLRQFIELSGGTAIMTREDDQGLYSQDKPKVGTRKNEDLKIRRAIINASNAHIYISIHLNSFSQSQYYGAQTFYNSSNKDSKLLAEAIQEELRTIIDRDNKRQVKPKDDVYILKDNSIPGALVECGFLSNYEEEQLLKDDKYQHKLAWAIFCGIEKYMANENSHIN